MRRFGLLTCLVFGFAAACGGADATLGDGGGDNDSGGGGDSIVGQDVVVVNCDGGQTSCGGTCVDTMTDMQNCGGCGVVCNTSCTAGVCQLIGSSCEAGTTSPVGDNACLTIDSTNVYWATGFNATGSVWKVPIGGGCPSLMIGAQSTPHGMASDGTNLFYANQGTGSGTGSIQRIAVGGGSPTPIATSQSTPLDVAVDATNVYWTNAGDGSVWKSDKLTPNPINLSPANGQYKAAYLAVDATNVYFTDAASGQVNRVAIAGGGVTNMTTSGILGPGHIAIDKTTAYFGSRGTSTSAILTVGLTASNATPAQLVTSLPSVNGIATDGTNIWFAEATNVQPYAVNTGEIHRVTVGGTSDAKLASKQNGPNCIAVDSTSVYWINSGGGMISKTGK